MFGMKPANTKVDPAAVFKKVIDLAISETIDAHVGSREIASYLRSRAQAIEDAAYRGQYTPPKH
jgi:hypothetical protein